MVRFDTYNASAHLVRQLEQSNRTAVIHDGGDNLLVQLITGERISIYLIETIIPPYEIRLTLADNNAAGIFTLFVIWLEMFLPEHNTIITPDEWLKVLYTLYGDRIYAFSVYGKDIHIFPVYFEHFGKERLVRYGSDVNVTNFGCDIRMIDDIPMLHGAWRIADFDHPGSAPASSASASSASASATHNGRNAHHHMHRPRTPWEVLGLDADADPDTVKRAYRRLAREYHPDTNISTDATWQMQHLNEAYKLIMRGFEQAKRRSENSAAKPTGNPAGGSTGKSTGSPKH